MNITEVKIRKPKNSEDTGIKAIAALVIDNVFIVNDIQIILTKSSKLFIKYPQNCFNQTMALPIEDETRLKIERKIMEKYMAS